MCIIIENCDVQNLQLCLHLVSLKRHHLSKSLINIPPLIWFDGNGLVIASHILGFFFDVTSLQEIHTKQSNDSIYLMPLFNNISVIS